MKIFLLSVLFAVSAASPFQNYQNLKENEDAILGRFKRGSIWDKLEDLVAPAKDYVEKAKESVEDLVKDIDLKQIGSDAEDFVSKIDFEGAAGKVEKTATDLWNTAVDGVKDIAESKFYKN